MRKRIRSLALSLSATAVVAAGAFAPGAAAQQQQDGLVNVAIGDITIQDVNVGVAANIAANVCGVKVGPVAVLARQVDRSGESRVVCSNQGGVELQQN